MNLIVSGWPAAGGTTTALLLALTLNYRYLYAGGLLKYMAEVLGFGNDGSSLVDFESIVGKRWDEVWESYREWKLTHSDRVVLDSKIAGFMQPPSANIYRIMLTADLVARHKHSQTDNRTINQVEISERDKSTGSRWRAMFGIDMYSLSDINKHYDLCIDNTNLTVNQTLETIYNALSMHPQFAQQFYFPNLVKQLGQVVDNFWSKGKAAIKQELHNKELILTPESLLAEIKSSLNIDLLQELKKIASR